MEMSSLQNSSSNFSSPGTLYPDFEVPADFDIAMFDQFLPGINQPHQQPSPTNEVQNPNPNHHQPGSQAQCSYATNIYHSSNANQRPQVERPYASNVYQSNNDMQSQVRNSFTPNAYQNNSNGYMRRSSSSLPMFRADSSPNQYLGAASSSSGYQPQPQNAYYNNYNNMRMSTPSLPIIRADSSPNQYLGAASSSSGYQPQPPNAYHNSSNMRMSAPSLPIIRADSSPNQYLGVASSSSGYLPLQPFVNPHQPYMPMPIPFPQVVPQSQPSTSYANPVAPSPPNYQAQEPIYRPPVIIPEGKYEKLSI